MKIKRMQTAGKIQFVVVSHFENKNAIGIKDMLIKIMVDKANEQMKAVNKTQLQQS